jgi:hypothetical protein
MEKLGIYLINSCGMESIGNPSKKYLPKSHPLSP